MKNLSLILNAVLLVAVAVLFYLHFSKPGSSASDAGAVSTGDVKVAFINSDSVLKYYDYFKVNRDRLEDRAKKMDNDFRNRAIKNMILRTNEHEFVTFTPTQITGSDESASRNVPSPISQNPPRCRAAQMPLDPTGCSRFAPLSHPLKSPTTLT